MELSLLHNKIRIKIHEDPTNDLVAGNTSW
jgi:hypothetical protein